MMENTEPCSYQEDNKGSDVPWGSFHSWLEAELRQFTFFQETVIKHVRVRLCRR